ncbi:hypothetical protein A1sIA53_00155 [Candidatus Planktophila dulcis]|uniref:hypothetical protein n=1 Tax=Candidatus Planktophila dulcis TaxID=1884914 RepID=UPI000BACE6DA|nr:hypothetical protein [Candidatus Planktophila dulcis]ASY14008.1 hypothetical protein A1sIA53_00155 [Candidatus Planktophila dulcis]
MSNYIRSPKRAAEINSQFMEYRAQDDFGMEPRLEAIKNVFSSGGMEFASAVDLGGACGFTSLELVDIGLVEHSVVYDLNSEFLSAGRNFASALGLSSKVIFKETKLSLEFIQDKLESGDLCLCLNLIHHGGNFFDKDFVHENGWEKFALAWLDSLREKFPVLVLSIGFKDKIPKNWITPTRLSKYDNRPLEFLHLATSVGWKLLYEANVGDIAKFGVDKAQGRRLRPLGKGTLFRLLDQGNFQLFRLRLNLRKIGLGKITKKKDFQYHLFVFQSAD